MLYRPSKYDRYKQSGIAWIREIPAHWEIWKVAHGFDVIGSGTTPKSDNPRYFDGNIDWVTTSELRETIIFNTIRKVTDLATREHPTLRKYPTGSLVIAMYGATIGRLGILGTEATVNQACCVFSSPRAFEIKFLFYWFWMYRPILLSVSSGGGQPNLSQEILRQLRVPLPPLGEQTRIAAFLDEKTAEIDAAIAKKQRLIELLQEQKAILINRAVTRGIDPNAPLRDSGVAWIGEMPAHWQISRSKWLFTARKERARPDDIQLSATQAYGVISQQEYMEREGRRVTQITEHLDKRAHVEIDDFVISMRSFEGGLERAWAAGCIRSSYVVLEPSPQVNVDFFTYLFKSQAYIQALRRTANFIRDGQDLNFDNFALVDLPVIPYDEQQAIADYLKQATDDLARGVALIQREIELLSEYRSILISDAVTGKIKV